MRKKVDIINMIRKTVHDTEPLAQAYLFGSRARGDAKKKSDWDVVVIVDSPKVTDEQFKVLNYELWEKGLELGEEINTILYTREQWENARPTLFQHNILKEGVKL